MNSSQHCSVLGFLYKKNKSHSQQKIYRLKYLFIYIDIFLTIKDRKTWKNDHPQELLGCFSPHHQWLQLFSAQEWKARRSLQRSFFLVRQNKEEQFNKQINVYVFLKRGYTFVQDNKTKAEQKALFTLMIYCVKHINQVKVSQTSYSPLRGKSAGWSLTYSIMSRSSFAFT